MGSRSRIILQLSKTFPVRSIFFVFLPRFDLTVRHTTKNGSEYFSVIFGNSLPSVKIKGIVHRILHAILVNEGLLKISWHGMRALARLLPERCVAINKACVI